jgi:hypothetical protein
MDEKTKKALAAAATACVYDPARMQHYYRLGRCAGLDRHSVESVVWTYKAAPDMARADHPDAGDPIAREIKELGEREHKYGTAGSENPDDWHVYDIAAGLERHNGKKQSDGTRQQRRRSQQVRAAAQFGQMSIPFPAWLAIVSAITHRGNGGNGGAAAQGGVL